MRAECEAKRLQTEAETLEQLLSLCQNDPTHLPKTKPWERKTNLPPLPLVMGSHH